MTTITLAPIRQTLTMIIPVLNEENGLGPLLDRLTPVLDKTGLQCSIIFVDDGSTDGTIARLRTLAAADPRIKAISLSRNFGKEIAVAAGLRYCNSDATIVMDSDLQHPPEVIPLLIAKWREGHDIVFGQRVDRTSDSLWRRLGARVFYRLFRHLSGTQLQEGSCDFRLLSRKAVEAINRIGERKRYNNGLFAWIGFDSAGVPFSMPPRAAGDSSRWAPVRLLRFALDGLVSFSTIPLRFWSVLGLAISGIAFLAMMLILVKTLIFGDPVRGYPTLMVSILFFSGIQLLSLGIIGEYIGRIYEEVKARPLFLVREELGLGEPVKAHDTEPVRLSS
jgi:glycosyltransferase involved in cell wall biosynthesis